MAAEPENSLFCQRPGEKVEPILAGLRPLFARHSGVMFVADVAVSRREYFGKSLTGS